MQQTIDVHQQFASFFEDRNTQTAAYAVSLKLEEGHTCLNIDEHNENVQSKSLEEHNPIYNQPIDKSALVNEAMVSQSIENVQPLILLDNNLYLHRYYSYESEIIKQINKLTAVGSDSLIFNEKALNKQKKFIEELFSDHQTFDEQDEDENTNWQMAAAITAVLSNFSIITGGPGTGKTTAVAKLLAILYGIKPDLNVALAAPTGKAAARMFESLKNACIGNEDKSKQLIKELKPLKISDGKSKFDQLNATTLHRLLGYKHGSHYFKNNQESTLNYDVIIIDECSMIGASMMAKLLLAVKSGSKIIMLGDKNQLASVEAGSIFGDICLTQKDCMNKLSAERAALINGFIENQSAQVSKKYIGDINPNNILQQHIIELKKSWRFKSTEGIGEFSHAVIQGEIPEKLLEKPNMSKQYVMVCNQYESEELSELINHYSDYIEEKDVAKALRKLNKLRILCAVRSGDYGVNHYNNLVENKLQAKGLIEASDPFYENQPIMITKNDKSLNLYNGDIGIIRINNDKYIAYFEDADSESGYREIATTYLSEYITVFAMTIHKSQGSEFDHVAIVLPNDENSPLLTRELIYTAITRAKKNAVIFSSNEVLKNGAAKQVERASGITKRFTKHSN